MRMDPLASYSLITLAIVRFLSAAVFYDFYLRSHKKKRLLLLTLGFLVLGVSPMAWYVSLLVTAQPMTDLLFVLSGVFASVGTLFVLTNLISYFYQVNLNYFLLGTSLLVLVPLFFLLLGFLELSQIFTISSQYLCIFAVAGLYLLHHRFVRDVGGNVIYLFYVLILVASVQLIGFFQEGILTEYLRILTIILSFVIVLIFFSLENSLLQHEKNLLKDKYSHNLSNLLQIVIGVIQVTEQSAKLTKDEKKHLQLALDKLGDAGDVINLIREV